MNSTKDGQSHSRRTLEPNRGAWKDRALDGLLEIHATVAALRSATGRIHKLQTPRPGHKDSGESELPNEWYDECQVASIDKHMCIDKSKS